jgi:23S rRNA (pseudouridine1915-N3)-methyltransferase
MMRILAIGRARSGPEAELFARYSARLRPPLALTEIAEAKGTPGEIRGRDSAALLAALPENAFAVALDLGGEMLETEAFAARLDAWLARSRPVCFVIGGAEGLDPSMIARAEYVLSLGRLTWPHLMVRAMLAEQIYRARSLTAGHPYHRAGRPSS